MSYKFTVYFLGFLSWCILPLVISYIDCFNLCFISLAETKVFSYKFNTFCLILNNYNFDHVFI